MIDKTTIPKELIDTAIDRAKNLYHLDRCMEDLERLEKNRDELNKEILELSEVIEVLTKQQKAYRDFLDSIGVNWREDAEANP